MVLTVLKGSGLRFQDFTGWKTSLLVDSESLPAFRHLRKPCGFIRLSKLGSFPQILLILGVLVIYLSNIY